MTDSQRVDQMPAALAGGIQAPPLPLAQELAFKLRQAGRHRQHQAARRGRGIDPEIDDAQVDAAFAEIVGQQEHLSRRTAKTADFGDGQRVPERKRSDQRIQEQTLLDALCVLRDYDVP
jgi:Ni/Co efflux regulator RcnB